MTPKRAVGCCKTVRTAGLVLTLEQLAESCILSIAASKCERVLAVRTRVHWSYVSDALKVGILIIPIRVVPRKFIAFVSGRNVKGRKLF